MLPSFALQEPILALGSWVFGHIASPPFDEDCFWPLLRPSAAFRPALNHVHSLLPPKYLALHQRTFGDNCIIILKVWALGRRSVRGAKTKAKARFHRTAPT